MKYKVGDKVIIKSWEEMMTELGSSPHDFPEELKIFLPNEKIITINIDSKLYVIDDFDFPDTKEASEWVDSLYEHELYNYLPPTEDDDYWNNIYEGSRVFHATTPDHIEDIKSFYTKKFMRRFMAKVKYKKIMPIASSPDVYYPKKKDIINLVGIGMRESFNQANAMKELTNVADLKLL